MNSLEFIHAVYKDFGINKERSRLDALKDIRAETNLRKDALAEVYELREDKYALHEEIRSMEVVLRRHLKILFARGWDGEQELGEWLDSLNEGDTNS